MSEVIIKSVLYLSECHKFYRKCWLLTVQDEVCPCFFFESALLKIALALRALPNIHPKTWIIQQRYSTLDVPGKVITSYYFACGGYLAVKYCFTSVCMLLLSVSLLTK